LFLLSKIVLSGRAVVVAAAAVDLLPMYSAVLSLFSLPLSPVVMRVA
jgi:hypothetical protein